VTDEHVHEHDHVLVAVHVRSRPVAFTQLGGLSAILDSTVMYSMNERFWRRQARRLARRANWSGWFARWAPWAAIAAAAGAPVLLIARRQAQAPLAAGAVGAAFVVLALVAAWSRHRARLGERDGLVWLEAGLGLHNRLSAAADGVGDWPSPDRFTPVFRWRGGRAFVPIAFALGLLAAAALVRISRPDVAIAARPEAPLAWRQTEEWLASLKETKVAQEDSVKPFEERLDELRSQPERRWYSESGLEASESLRDELRSEIRSLATDMDAAAGALEGADGSSGAQGIDHRRLQGATSSLASRALQVDPNLLQKLRQAAGDGKRISTADASALARKLREGAGFCRSSLRECREGDPGCFRTARRGNGRNGGIDRGPGPAPLTLDEADLSKVGPARMEGVSNEDLRQAALGDVVETTSGRHQVTPRARGVTAGGTAGRGRGGYEVGHAALTPEERRILSRYFDQ
jgi:hypothetical protein